MCQWPCAVTGEMGGGRYLAAADEAGGVFIRDVFAPELFTNHAGLRHYL